MKCSTHRFYSRSLLLIGVGGHDPYPPYCVAGPVFRSDAAKQKPRRQPCCGFCRNHDLEVPVINHHCDYAKCTCALCELTRRRRLVMCHQQRLWRYKKNNARQKDGEEHSSEDEVAPTATFPQEEQLDLLDPALNRPRRKMVSSLILQNTNISRGNSFY